MTFRCRGTDNVFRDVEWRLVNKAYLPAITVCNQAFYTITATPVIPACDEGQELCDGECADLDTDANNCGACGNECGEGEECIDGECISVALPLVSTDALDIIGYDDIRLTGTITDEGSSDVTEYGFVYSTETDTPTLEDGIVIVVGSGSFTGEFETDETIEDPQFNTQYYFRAYATNSSGTEYGETISEMVFICLIKGTQISLASGGTKAIEEISYDDTLLVWNFDDGKPDEAKPVWIMKKFSMPSYSLAHFSDGSILGTIDNNGRRTGHSIFNEDAGKFTHLNSADTPLNTNTFNQLEERVQLLDVERVEEEVEFYNIITNSHFNLFANGILTSTTLNNIYPIEGMKFVKSEITPRSIEEFGVSNDIFKGMRLAEQPRSYARLVDKIKVLVKNSQ